MSAVKLTRRQLLRAGAATGAAVTLAGCDQFDFLGNRDHPARDFLEGANSLTYQVQRLLLGRDALAREYSESEVRQGQRPNGSRNPGSAEYRALRDNDYRDYRLRLVGLVDNPLELSLTQLRNMPARTQITRHDCVEGWSCIAKWSGVPLHLVLDEARLRDNARYLVFHCYDTLGGGLGGQVPYYESCDMIDARHPQTILAYGLNDETLALANGAPIRVRIERQLGYKMAKYIHTIEAVSHYSSFHGGHGGYWEDRGYEWYAGI